MKELLMEYYLANPAELPKDKAAVLAAWRELALSGGRQEIELSIAGVTSKYAPGSTSQLEQVAKLLTEIAYAIDPDTAIKPVRPTRYI